MSSGHCVQCGAKTSLWSPACAFCGAPASGTGMRTRSVADAAFTTRRMLKREPVLGGFRAWVSRLFSRR
jgi:hypothetical protein